MKNLKKQKYRYRINNTTGLPRRNYGERPHGDNQFSGVTPALVHWNLLQKHTNPGDLVVDPMCGSGTTIDVVKELDREVIGYDMAPYRGMI